MSNFFVPGWQKPKNAPLAQLAEQMTLKRASPEGKNVLLQGHAAKRFEIIFHNSRCCLKKLIAETAERGSRCLIYFKITSCKLLRFPNCSPKDGILSEPIHAPGRSPSGAVQELLTLSF